MGADRAVFKDIYVFSAVLGLLGSVLLPGNIVLAEGAGSAGVKMREVSLRYSFQDVLEENKRLKEEKEKAENKLRKLEGEVRLYAGKATMLQNRINSLTEQLEERKTMAVEDKEKMIKNLLVMKENEGLIEENRRLVELIEEINKKRGGDKYFNRWKKAQKQLKSLTARLRENTVAREKLIEENGKMHYNLGGLFFQKGDYEKAAAEYEKALEFLPNDTDVHYNLGIIYDYYIKDGKKAALHYESCMSKDGDLQSRLLIKERIAENNFKAKIANQKYSE